MRRGAGVGITGRVGHRKPLLIALAGVLLVSYFWYRYTHSREPEFLKTFHAREVTDPFFQVPGTRRFLLDGDFETVRQAMRDELPGSGWNVWEKGVNPKSIDMGIFAERSGDTLTLLLQYNQVLMRSAEDGKLIPGQVEDHVKPVILQRSTSPNWMLTQWGAIKHWFSRQRE